MIQDTSPVTTHSLQASTRVQAEAIWRGPLDITIPNGLGGDTFYGWAVLSLEASVVWANNKWKDRVEIRSVYGNLFDDSQEICILKAVTWDGRANKQAIKEQGSNYQLCLPARFVELPVAQLKSWLAEFNGITTTLDASGNDYPETINKRLRIEQDPKSNVFEKIWKFSDPDRLLLNEKWESVWLQMTQALLNNTTVNNFEEDFWVFKPVVKYDWQTFQPDQVTTD